MRFRKTPKDKIKVFYLRVFDSHMLVNMVNRGPAFVAVVLNDRPSNFLNHVTGVINARK